MCTCASAIVSDCVVWLCERAAFCVGVRFVCTRLKYVHANLKIWFFCDMPWMHTRQKEVLFFRELPLFLCLKNGSRSRGDVQVHARREESDCFERREISRIHWKWQADQLLGTCFQYATLCKWYTEEISCQLRHSRGPFHPAEISLTFKTNWVCLLMSCIRKYLPWFIYHFFVVVFLNSFALCTYDIRFFFFFFWLSPPLNLHLERMSWMCGQNVSWK